MNTQNQKNIFIVFASTSIEEFLKNDPDQSPMQLKALLSNKGLDESDIDDILGVAYDVHITDILKIFNSESEFKFTIEEVHECKKKICNEVKETYYLYSETA